MDTQTTLQKNQNINIITNNSTKSRPYKIIIQQPYKITTIQNQNITTVQQNQNMHTTTNYSLYVVKSTSVIKNRCSKPRGGIFEILFNFVKEITRIF